MYEYVDKSKENNSRAVAHSIAQKKSNGKQGSGIVDNHHKPMCQTKIYTFATQMVRESETDGKNFNYIEAKAKYDSCKKKGKEHWKRLNEAISKYYSSSETIPVDTYNWGSRYKTEVKKLNDSYFSVKTTWKDAISKSEMNLDSRDLARWKKRAMQDKEWGKHIKNDSESLQKVYGKYKDRIPIKGPVYKGIYFTEDMRFAKTQNYRNDDGVKYSSDVMWMQINEVLKAAQKDFSYIQKIQRFAVSEDPAISTIWFCYPNEKSYSSKDNLTLQPETDDFNAICGTPNGHVQIHMLADHVHETGGMTVKKITIEPEKITFHLEKSPKPMEKSPKTKKCCFITTACTQLRGLPDDCEELTLLRSFRDNYLIQKANGQKLIELYYEYSPGIVAAIRRSEDEEEILKRLYRIIRKCVDAIKRGDNEFAFRTYCKMVMELTEEFLPKYEIPSYLINEVRSP